jgi:hypothetical protein
MKRLDAEFPSLLYFLLRCIRRDAENLIIVLTIVPPHRRLQSVANGCLRVNQIGSYTVTSSQPGFVSPPENHSGNRDRADCEPVNSPGTNSGQSFVRPLISLGV